MGILLPDPHFNKCNASQNRTAQFEQPEAVTSAQSPKSRQFAALELHGVKGQQMVFERNIKASNLLDDAAPKELHHTQLPPTTATEWWQASIWSPSQVLGPEPFAACEF